MRRAVVWASSARTEFVGIVRYIAVRNPDAAERVAARIDNVAEKLGGLATGRAGRVTGTYEKPVPGLPFILAYEIVVRPEGGEAVLVLHVIHGARDWQEGTWP